MLGLCWAQLGFSSPRKTLMEALSAWILLKPELLLAPGRWCFLASPSLSTITLLSRLMQLIPQLSSQFDSPSVEHCNADRFYERRTRPPIGRAEVNPASYWPQRDVSKLTCWFGSLLHFHPLLWRAEQLWCCKRGQFGGRPCEPPIIGGHSIIHVGRGP